MTACPNRSTASVLPLGSKPILSKAWSAESATRRRLPRGGYLFRPGDPADFLYFVEDGLVKLSVCSETGRDLTLSLYGAGEFFGEEIVLAGSERFAFAVAIEDASLLAFSRARVRELSERDREVALFLTRLVSERLSDSARQMEALAWNTVPARLAAALLRLARRGGFRGAIDPRGRMDPDGTRVQLRITHQELANLIGSTRETTTATLSAFRRRGWIDLVRREILLLRPDLLSAAAHSQS